MINVCLRTHSTFSSHAKWWRIGLAFFFRLILGFSSCSSASPLFMCVEMEVKKERREKIRRSRKYLGKPNCVDQNMSRRRQKLLLSPAARIRWLIRLPSTEIGKIKVNSPITYPPDKVQPCQSLNTQCKPTTNCDFSTMRTRRNKWSEASPSLLMMRVFYDSEWHDT